MLPYNKKSKSSIYNYAKKLEGKTFRQVINESIDANYSVQEPSKTYYVQEHKKYKNKKRKGGLGEVIEEHYFFYTPDNKREADFPDAQLELKVTPYKRNKNGSISAKERLVLCMIDYHELVLTTFYKSHLWSKLENILLIYYLWEKDISDRLEYTIDFVYLLSVSGEDLDIIKEDYEKIQKKVRQGEAHLLSEADTLYLGAVTKSSNSKIRTTQPYSDEEAKPRAFSLKTTYMTYVLRNYIEPLYEDYGGKNKRLDKIKKKPQNGQTFEQIVVDKINKYVNYKTTYLFEKFLGTTSPSSKNKYNELVLKILGVNTKNAEEFEKANIEIKTVRVNKNGKLPEHMSFPVFKIKKLVAENWEDSTLRNVFEKTKFLFVVFVETDEGYILQGSKFWNMPIIDLETKVKEDWLLIQKEFIEGVKFSVLERKKGKYIVRNSLPKASETNVIHVRPHARLSYYEIDGIKYGSGKRDRDADELLNGDYMTKQCFWLNKEYIYHIIKEIL